MLQDSAAGGASRRDEPQPRDLRRCAEALRGSPVAGAAARVDPQPAQPLEAGGERLLEAHEEVPGQKLSTVRVSGQLQMESGVRGDERGARLVRKEYPGARAFRGAGSGCTRVAAMRRIEMMRTVVGDAGDYQQGTFVLQDDMFVDEHREPEAAQLG